MDSSPIGDIDQFKLIVPGSVTLTPVEQGVSITLCSLTERTPLYETIVTFKTPDFPREAFEKFLVHYTTGMHQLLRELQARGANEVTYDDVCTAIISIGSFALRAWQQTAFGGPLPCSTRFVVRSESPRDWASAFDVPDDKRS